MIQHDSGLSTASLEVLGDLFFSAPARRRPHDKPAQTAALMPEQETDHPADAAEHVHSFMVTECPAENAAEPSAPAKPAVQSQFCQQLAHSSSIGQTAPLPDRLDLDALVLLGGGLSAEGGRLKAAWTALKRLAPSDGRMLVLTITESGAWIQRYGQWDDAPDSHVPLDLLTTMADGMVIIVGAPLATMGPHFSLPPTRVVLAEGGRQATIAAYAELKAAASDLQPAELFVIDGNGDGDAEQVYRRLAQVAISHLEMSPTFAGHAHRAAECDCPLLSSWLQPVTPEQTARLIAAVAIDRHKPESPESPESPGTPEPPEPPEPAGAPEFDMPLPTESKMPHQDAANSRCWDPSDNSAASSPPPPPPPAPPQSPPGEPPTLSFSGRAGQGEYGRFGAWQPATREELIKAVRESLPAILPQVAKVLAPQELADDAAMPDLLAFDGNGRAAGLVLSLDGSAGDAARAGSAADWIQRYARLLSMASGLAQSHAAAIVPPIVLLVPQELRHLTDRLTLDGVRRMTWRGASFAGHRGLIIESCAEVATKPPVVQSPTAEPAVALSAPRAEIRHVTASAVSGRDRPVATARAVQVARGLAVSLPDGDWPNLAVDEEGLTRAELEALKKNLEIEEMT